MTQRESVSWLNPQRFRSRQRLELFSLLLVFILITSWLSHFHEMEQGNYPFFFKALGKGKRKQKYICILKIKNGKEKKDTSENML